MICPECGSYQPDRAKYCGICGSGLSQDGLVESFLKHDPEHDMDLPHHRSFWFYTIIVCAVVLALAVFAGAGYIVYRIAWGEEKGELANERAVDTSQVYHDPELGFSISYPETWTVEMGVPAENELTALSVNLTSRKGIDLIALQLDPLVSIGGIEAIEEYLAEDAVARIQSLGGKPGSSGTSQPTAGQPGYGQEETQPPGDEEPAATEEDGAELLTSTQVAGLPAYYTEFSANFMGEETKFLLYYIVAGDTIFVFKCHAPYGEFKDVRPQFFAITGSFKWDESDGEEVPDETPDISVLPGIGPPPVITFS